jgi:hypothetical protein
MPSELVFNSAGLLLGRREAADLHTKSALWRIHPDKNRRDVCATRGNRINPAVAT